MAIDATLGAGIMTAAFRSEDEAQRITLVFSGRLDTAAAMNLQDAVLARIHAVAPGQILRFDLGAVEFVASSFLRLCIQATRALGNERFELARPTPLVREVFTMAGLDQHLRIVDPGA